MNERIRELAIQAAKKHGHTIQFTEEITETLDSFAELIVKETLQVARAGIEYGAGMEDAVYKYFGVGE